MTLGGAWRGWLLAAALGVAFAGDEAARGRALVDRGDWKGAEEALEEAVAASPDDAASWALLGTTRNALTKYAEARQACERALSLDPSLPRARFDLGVALYNLDRSSDAAAHFDAVLAGDPAHADAAWMRGHCALRGGDLPAAESFFCRAAELSRRYRALGPLFRGIVATLAGRKEDAGARFEEAYHEAPASQVGVMAQAYRERLADATPSETLLRPEDYLPVQGEWTIAYDVPSAHDASGYGWTKATLSADGAVSFDRPMPAIAARALLQVVDLCEVHSRSTKEETRAVILPGWTCNGALVRFDHVESSPPPLADYSAAMRLVWTLLADGGEGDQAMSRTIEGHRLEVDAAVASGVLGDLVFAIRADEQVLADTAARREAMLVERAARDPKSGLGRVLERFEKEMHAKTVSSLDAIARLLGSPPRPTDGVERYLRDARTAYEAGAFETAALLYRMALLRDPSKTEALAGRGKALSRAGRYDEAAADLERAPAEGIEVGRALTMIARYDEAIHRLEPCADSWQALELLGLCRLWTGRWEEAEASFRKALETHTERSAFHRFHLACSLHARGKRTEARAEWRACAEAAPSSFHGMLAWGLSTTRSEAAQKKTTADAATAAVERLSKCWGALARIEAFPQHEAAAALRDWMEAARRRGGELGAALGAELTEARRAACGSPSAEGLLDESLRQAAEDAREATGEEQGEARARVLLIQGMKRALSPQK